MPNLDCQIGELRALVEIQGARLERIETEIMSQKLTDARLGERRDIALWIGRGVLAIVFIAIGALFNHEAGNLKW